MAENINLTLPDGKVLCEPVGVTGRAVAEKIGPKLAQAAIAVKVNDHLYDVLRPLTESGKFAVITLKSPEASEVYRHSLAHIMAEAVQRLFPDAQFAIGPTIEDGFYYDFLLSRSLTEDDLGKIEAEMKKIIAANAPFKCEVVARDEAIKRFEALKQPFKTELIGEFADEKVSIYSQGGFVDLCRGPHLPHTGLVPHFKLMSVAGAYWRGDERRPMLQRIYGTAFPSKAELDEYLQRIEEAKKRDHRKLGKELDLFSMHEEVGPGLCFWHPNGARIRHAIETFWKEQHYKHGYDLLYTPHIGRSWLWETSGHLGFYRDSMYAAMKIDDEDYFIKPMNCPFHIMIYKTQNRSYRDLPLRWAELGTVYRYEKSGVLHGLMRVRGFTQDDAHIYCTPEQIEDEIVEVLRFSLAMWKAFGFEKIKAYLATRPEKAVGDPERWDQAIAALRRAIDREKLECEVDEGGGAFYGPKIDLKVKDAIGREWQMTTVQFDFNLPERFDMTYVGADGQKHRPYMVHRALLGSLERFFGVLIEHHAGAMPLWLAPLQVEVLTITDAHTTYAREVADKLRQAGVRVHLDDRGEKIGYKIRQAQMAKVPLMLVIGGEEVQKQTVTVRFRNGDNKPGVNLDEFMREQPWKI